MKGRDLTGEVFGQLTVLGLSHRDKHGSGCWDVKCECGNSIKVSRSNLTSGRSKACGCKRRTHGATNTRTYKSWRSMLQRVMNPNSPDYPRYGGCGIKICDRWLNSFENFLEDMGERPPSTTIDRENGKGNYEPDNCRWATVKEQNRNMSSNRLVTYKGETKTLMEWSEIVGVKYVTLQKRLNKGCLPEIAFIKKRFKKGELDEESKKS